MNPVCDMTLLHKSEDRHVDALLTGFPRMGATVITAEVPRSYIDFNRNIDDITQRQLADRWDGTWPLAPSVNCDRGTGVIWSRVYNEYDIYGQKLTSAQARARLKGYYIPYYTALHDRAGTLKTRFGKMVHLNIHSMPKTASEYDIVLGDLKQRSCSPGFLEVVRRTFQSQGFSVVPNLPYSGARLTELFADPKNGCESLQIEIRRDLYLKDDMLTVDAAKSARMRQALEKVLGHVITFITNPDAKQIQRHANVVPIRQPMALAAK
jgi:N-formylglutamate deformylase